MTTLNAIVGDRLLSSTRADRPKGARPLKVLLAEVSPADAELLAGELQRAGFEPDWRRVDTEPDFLAQLHGVDLVLADFSMPQLSGLRLLELLAQSGLDVPAIFVSGAIGEETAVEVMKHGAVDCLPKDRLARLGAAVSFALDQSRLRRAHKAAMVTLHRTERKQRELATQLTAEKARLVAAQAVAKVGSWEMDLSTLAVVWSDETHRIFETDPRHFAPTHPRFLELVHPADRALVDEAFVKSLSSRSTCAVEHQILLPRGRTKIVEERWQVFRDDHGQPTHAVGTSQDITEHKQAEQMLRISEGRYRTLFEYSPDGILISDSAGCYLDANVSICRMLGYARDELLHLKNTDIVVQEEIAESEPALNVVRAGAGYPGECTLRRKDGSTFPVEILATQMPDGNMLGVIRNITVQMAQKREIVRLSRLYAALGQVSKAIVTTRSREALLETVCRVLVESGGFRMAWIGSIEAETRRVTPVAQWGDTTNYLSQIQIFADNRPEGQGPAGRSIREGKYAVTNDFLHDLGAQPWREPADRAGFRAAAAFPIREGGAVCGTMMVYTEEAGMFQDKEIALLENAAHDVSFGLDNLNREFARQQAEGELRIAEGQLHALVNRLHTVREEEAKRIARELHDDLGQKLTVLNMELTNLGGSFPDAPVNHQQQIERMHGVVDETIEVVQRISGELRLGQLDMLGLTSAIDWHLKEFARRSGIPCRITRLDETQNLPDAKSTAVFRILQEALTNIARHAGASEILVGLHAESNELTLMVHDNGRGITASELSDRKSFGLLGMRERALIVGGTITISGDPGAGTTVFVRIPLDRACVSPP